MLIYSIISHKLGIVNMIKTKICLCLCADTLRKNLEILNTYRNYVDMVELRADYLTPDEALHIRKFPEMAKIPTILTVRRKCDGGTYTGGESSRTTIFARGLAYADKDAKNNFAYIDMEEDYYVPGLQDAALAFDIKIIRSYHNMTDSNIDFDAKMRSMVKTSYEMPKIACMPNSLSDVTNIFNQVKNIDYNHIVCGMGAYGVSTRILANQLGSFLTYCSPPNTGNLTDVIGHIDPIILNEQYGFKTINKKTEIFGVTGFPLKKTDSPALHSKGYRLNGVNAVYLPIKSETIEETLEFAEAIGIKGLSVTVPHKETVLEHLEAASDEIGNIGACNTIHKENGYWKGFNTDASGFKKAIAEFLEVDDLKGRKAAIIGAGGSAKAVAYALNELGCDVCVFNRTIDKARRIANLYGFRFASFGVGAYDLLEEYSEIIIQTTPIGMGWDATVDKTGGDPLEFYTFSGKEKIYDIIYYPEKTPLLERAEKSGCKISNGRSMLEYQAHEQFKIFTGVPYNAITG